MQTRLRHPLLTSLSAWFAKCNVYALRLHPAVLITLVSLLFVVLDARAQTIYEAENPSYTARQNCTVGSSWQGFTGSGFVEYMTQRGASALTFTVTAPAAGMYTITSRYAAASTYVRSMSVYVNGRDVTQAQFPSTTSWETWATQAITVNLAAETNTVMYRYDNDDSGSINLDYIQVTPALSAGYSMGGAAAAGWFPQEISVDQFTGTALVGLPLATVTAPGLTVPVRLAYAATGVQVDDDGGSVGVNWALQAGMSIRREVRGLPDDIQALSSTENRYGWLRYPTGTSGPDVRLTAVPDVYVATIPLAPPPASAPCGANEQTARAQLDQLGPLQRSGSGPYNMYDTEPDIFYYSLPGHSGKFVFDAQGLVRTIPYDPITVTRSPISSNDGIGYFTIKTPDGNSYFFGNQDVVSQTTTAIVSNPKFLLRDYFYFNLPSPQSIRFFTNWHISTITSPAQASIVFEYDQAPADYGAPQGRQMQRFLVGNATGVPPAEYRTNIQYLTTQWLSGIYSSSMAVRFELQQYNERSFYIKSIAVNSKVDPSSAGEVPLKRYTLSYSETRPDYTSNQRWTNELGTAIDKGTAEVRRFLTKIQVTTGTVTQPLYTFAYHQVTDTSSPLPPPGTVAKDYWGYYNANGASTLIPQLYVYPQLGGTRPGAPYRLFEAPDLASGGLVLSGADRRPAADLNTALAGTLTEMTFTGGGKALFEYERHRFYDPVAQQSLPAGGLRLRTLKAQDPITKVEVRRDYGYQDEDGTASGRLLHAPRFAFAVPTLGPVQWWTNATVRCGQDLSVDPFESRAIGYHQVVEKMPGKGQVITTFDVSGTADENAVAATTACVGWARPMVGFGRQSINGNCPSVAPVATGTELYPFAATPNYDFRRGLPQRIQYLAEPVGTTAGALVRQQDFVYQYRYPQTVAHTVTGLAYERTGNDSDGMYAYAKYGLLTDFQYVLRQQTVTVPNQTATNTTALSGYRYNDRGWVAATGSQNSDGSYVRTRYKYLTDYTLSSNTSDPLMQAMYQRLTATPEQISGDVVETISEVVNTAGEVRFKGATLQTYAIEPATSASSNPALTRPYQVLHWEQLPPLPLSRDIDSTRQLNNALHISSNYKPVSTTVEVDHSLQPVSTRVVAGRKVSGQHLGYGRTLPVMQVANALASEVVFSDFETYKTDNYFSAYSTTSTQLLPTNGAARTGKFGVELLSTSYLMSPLPASTASAYRLSFWAKASQATTVDVTFIGAPALTAQTVSVDGNGDWKLYELVLDWSAISSSARSNYNIKLTPRSTVQVDDVTLLPAQAVSVSTTYDVTLGKTSETDSRGRTTYYEYSPAGELATVRDHNRSITRQYDRVIAGRYQSAATTTKPFFTVAGSLMEGEELVFTVDTNPSFGQNYTWNFADNSSAVSTTANPTRHTFQFGGSYAVQLQVTNSQGRVYQTTQTVNVSRKQFTITPCIAGIVAVDDCRAQPNQVDISCNPAASTTGTTFSVQVNLPGPYTYAWEVARLNTNGDYGAWEPIVGANSASYAITAPRSTNMYRCYVTAGGTGAGGYDGYSEVMSIVHTQSTNCTP